MKRHEQNKTKPDRAVNENRSHASRRAFSAISNLLPFFLKGYLMIVYAVWDRSHAEHEAEANLIAIFEDKDKAFALSKKLNFSDSKGAVEEFELLT